MQFQFVLQWRISTRREFKALLKIEDILFDGLTDGSVVDGHDVGSGACNIFIHTDNPHATFEAIKLLLGDRTEWRNVHAGFRRFEEDAYTPIWPTSLTNFELL